MIAERLFPYAKWLEKFDLIKHPKLYFFDVGVYNGLQKSFAISSDRVGGLAEQLVYQQLTHTGMALQKNLKIHTARTRRGVELDFLVELDSKTIGLEVKTSGKVIEDDVRHLVHFKKQEKDTDFYLFHFGKEELKVNGIWCLPVGTGFREIGL
jgi:predicted AAA+ superfamily ATPase